MESAADGDRCEVCGKRIRLSMVQCKCRRKLCGRHVFAGPGGHACDYDYRLNGRVELEKKLVPVTSTKVDKI